VKEEVRSSLVLRYQEMNKKIERLIREKKLTQRITLVAVSKTQSADSVEELYRAGHRHFGENYAQELIEKATDLEKRGCGGILWHFIGHLQSNKIKGLIGHVSYIHSIHSVKLASELSKHWQKLGRDRPLPVFLQVNIDQEVSKSGFSEEDLLKAKEELSALAGLDYLGLMCIPKATAEEAGAAKSAFRRLKELESRLSPMTHGMLSMGMSDDFELAMEEGATHLRVGTALFGLRS